MKLKEAAERISMRDGAGRSLLRDGVMRASALVSLGLALLMMARIIGWGALEPSRFDTMSGPWQAAVLLLVALHAASGFGLWSLAGWGLVLWGAAVLVQITMHAVYSAVFGTNFALVSVLLLVTAINMAFLVYEMLRKR